MLDFNAKLKLDFIINEEFKVTLKEYLKIELYMKAML